jgi:hypothetical protein
MIRFFTVIEDSFLDSSNIRQDADTWEVIGFYHCGAFIEHLFGFQVTFELWQIRRVSPFCLPHPPSDVLSCMGSIESPEFRVPIE